MGLDLVLGGFVLVAAIRGWLKGFVVQAIRLVGLVAAVYAAAPVRDLAKPYAIKYLPSIRPDLVDRLFWWVSAVGCYFVIVGVTSLVVAKARRPSPLGIGEANRSDQFAGLGLGLAKGLIVVCFLVASLEKYGEPYLDKVPYGPEQSKESTAWEWNKRFHPAARIWAAKPVKNFVAHIQKMGLNGPGDASDADEPVQTASRTPKLALTPDQISGLDTSKLPPEMAQAIKALQRELKELDALK
jgi:uncharacterized membrane protein required for colicin V production